MKAHFALQLMMRTIKSRDVSQDPEWQALAAAVEELKRLYRVETIAQHAWCSGDVKHLDSVFDEEEEGCLD